MEILNIALGAILIFLPAYIANAMPVIASGLKIFPKLAKPINEKTFGKSKTYRGFVMGIAGALFVGLLQSYFGMYEEGFAHSHHVEFTLILSFLLGFGALFGDLVKSFFKRRIGKKSGESWLIFDQIDYILGAIFFSSLIISIDFKIIIAALIISPLLSLGANIIAYKLKIKKVWW